MIEKSFIIVTIRPSRAVKLARILNQRLRDDRKSEILIINSGKRQIRGSGKIRVINKKLSVSQARNLAVKEARGEKVIFIDDDCEPAQGWEKEITKFPSEKVVCVVGRTIPKEYSKFDQYFDFDRGPKEKIFKSRYVIPSKIGTGNNVCFRKKIFNEIKFFEKPYPSGEDLDVFYKILKKGYQIYYNPKAIVYHDSKHHDKNLEKVAYNYGIGTWAILKENPDPWMLFLYFAILLKLLTKIYDPVWRSFLRGMLRITFIK